MKLTTNLWFALLLGLSVGLANAAGDAAAGKAKAAVCAGCHGATGVSVNPMYPNIAGQHAQYLAQSLHDYKSGARNNATMKAMVAALSDEDIDNLAAYYSGMSCK